MLAPYPTHIQVGPVRIEPAVLLAPMEGVTNLTFRRMIRRIGGVGLTVTEFVASKGIVQQIHRDEEMAAFDPDEHPVAVQIYGRDPEAMGEAARILTDLGPDIIDINMGCPSKRVCARSGGSALMKDPELALQIVRAVRRGTDRPVTVKMRSGFSADNRNAPELAYACQEEGASMITIHWRTREDRYGGVRDVTKIAETVDRLQIPVVANGDIVDISSARQMLDDTGCAGLMVGRGAMRNPWLIRQLGQWMRGEDVLEPTLDERRRLLLAFIEETESTFRTPKAALGRIKGLCSQYLQGWPAGLEVKKAALRSKTIEELREHLDQAFVDVPPVRLAVLG